MFVAVRPPASCLLSRARCCFPVGERRSLSARCSRPDGGEAAPASSSNPPLLKAISEVSKVDGRVPRTTNMVIEQVQDWRALDDKVNSYPMNRGFTAIGSGGEDFVQAMVVAVESVLECSVPQGGVNRRLSSKGKYISVSIGPVEVESFEQVQAVYEAMRRDSRMKYLL